MLCLFLSCSSEDDTYPNEEVEIESCCAASTETRGSSNQAVLFRKDYPSTFQGNLLIQYPRWFTTRARQNLKIACQRLSTEMNGIRIIHSKRLPYNAEISLKKSNVSNCGGIAVSDIGDIPGLWTRINLDSNTTLNGSNTYVRSLFMHEIAHCLGIWHPGQPGGKYRSVILDDGFGVMHSAGCGDTVPEQFNTGEKYTLNYMWSSGYY